MWLARERKVGGGGRANAVKQKGSVNCLALSLRVADVLSRGKWEYQLSV